MTEVGIGGYLPKKEKMALRVRQATEVNKKYLKFSRFEQELRNYRHAKMKAEFKRGSIGYGKHMEWL